MSTTYALLGSPVSQSLSPALYNAAFASASIDATYETREARAMDLVQAIAAARTELAGFNVTAPHKETVLKHLDVVDADVARVGAANTVVVRDGRLHAHNTDITGFIRALGEEDFNLSGKRLVVLGTGGAARAVVEAALREQAQEIVVAGRRHERSIALCEALCSAAEKSNLIAATLRDSVLKRALEKTDLLVHATSVQARGGDARVLLEMLPLESLSSRALAMDLAYSKGSTFFCDAATKQGCRTIDGRGMLLHQATIAFKLFTGENAPIASMRTALTHALQSLDA